MNDVKCVNVVGRNDVRKSNSKYLSNQERENQSILFLMGYQLLKGKTL